MRRLTATLVAAFVIALPSIAVGRDAAEVELVRRGLGEIVTAAPVTPTSPNQRTQRAAALLERYVDLAAFESRVLADIDGSLTPAQRKTLSEALRALLVARIAIRLPDVPRDPPSIDSPRTENGETRLRVVYHVPDDVAVDLVFAKAGAQPRIVDATFAGASLSKNLRASVNRVMRRDGFDGLVARLAQLRDRTTSGPHKSSDLTL